MVLSTNLLLNSSLDFLMALVVAAKGALASNEPVAKHDDGDDGIDGRDIIHI
jgi:hypothetical protein